MERFPAPYEGRGVPLRRGNVDTDQIIPAVFLRRVSRTGFADALFAGWRSEPGFVLDRPEYTGATVLVAGPDFGTGSSREHAVWALQDAGFRVVVSSRFGDIFRGNALTGGLLTVTVPEPVVEALWEQIERDPTTPVRVDLPRRRLQAASVESGFDLDDYTAWRLLEGLDDIALTLRHEDEITAYEQRRAPELPRVS